MPAGAVAFGWLSGVAWQPAADGRSGSLRPADLVPRPPAAMGRRSFPSDRS